jgi:SM-20-related protein
MTPVATGFTINPALDIAALAAEYAARGHVSVSDFLTGDGADRLHGALAARSDWAWAVSAGETVYDITADARAEMSPVQHAELDARVNAAARDGFQFRFSSLRVPDTAAERRADDLLHRFATFMAGDDVRAFAAALRGQDDVRWADAQGTAYHPGDFLTGHDDDVAGKHRLCAYVMGLTPAWRPEWGGLLLFHRDGGRIDGLVPGFNRLNLFALPVVHSVSQVTPFAGGVRYAVTGWLRGQVVDT